MVQSILFFILGFLCAGFLATMIAPAVWRRAVTLTRRRVEASAPQTLAEIQADKDQLRAEFAMSTRRLEMTIKSLKEKSAAQLVEISRGREELKELAAEWVDKNQTFTELEAKNAELRAELGQREEQLRRLSDKLAESQRSTENRGLELEKLGRMYDEASFSSSNRQIELVARESELEKLAGEVSTLRTQRKEADRHQQEAALESRSARDALKAEKKKAADLDKKLEQLLAIIADREERLERRENEVARLRKQVKANADAVQPVNAQGVSTPLPDVNGSDVEKTIAKLDADRERLEARLMTLARENKRLRTGLAASGLGKNEDGGQAGDALLREQMGQLAAEVVNLTAMLDGPGSPIAKALAVPAGTSSSDERNERATSLADRVRALQKAASGT